MKNEIRERTGATEADGVSGVVPTDSASHAAPTHTPGPWHFVETNVGVTPDHGYCLLHGEADVFGWERNLFVSVACSHRAVGELGKGVPEANAHLIAAAPEMLAVLRDMEWLGLNDGRGVTHRQCPACSALQSRGTGHNAHCGLSAAIAKAEGRS